MDKLEHLGVFVSDLETSRRFYQERLGMSFVDASEDENVDMVTLRKGNQEIHLFKAKDPNIKPHLDHVAYQVSKREFDGTVEDFKRRGIAFSGPHRYKNTQFIKFKDPDGVTWEFVAYVG
ncbi:MAG: VOC family protein [Oligoflexales bacterium]